VGDIEIPQGGDPGEVSVVLGRVIDPEHLLLVVRNNRAVPVFDISIMLTGTDSSGQEISADFFIPTAGLAPGEWTFGWNVVEAVGLDDLGNIQLAFDASEEPGPFVAMDVTSAELRGDVIVGTVVNSGDTTIGGVHTVAVACFDESQPTAYAAALLDVSSLGAGESAGFTTGPVGDPAACASFAVYAVGIPDDTTVAPPTTASVVPGSAPTTAPPASPTSAMLTAPPIDATLANAVPAVPGFRTDPSDPAAVPWPLFELPESVRIYPVSVASLSGGVGTLVVVDGVDFAAYSAQVFDEAVPVLADTEPSGDELVVMTNTAQPTWQSVGGVPVIAAVVPEGDDGQWVWEHDGRTFIALGSLAMERYVAGLVAAQEALAPRDPYDDAVLHGELAARLTFIPGYEYVTVPVDEAISTLAISAIGDCAENVLVGYVVPAGDPDPEVMEAEDVGLVMATVSGFCSEGGFFEQLPPGLASQGFAEAAVAGTTVWQDPTRLIFVEQDVVIQMHGSDPAAFAAMRPFVDRFVAGVWPAEILDLAPLPIPTCIYQEPADPGEVQLDQPAYVVDCVTPHQGELYHHDAIDAAVGAPYPGDAAVGREASLRCQAAFEPYVGLDYDGSRLDYVYFYPSPETWAEGDRGVHCVLFAGVGEFLTGSLAGTAQ
jgi:hypothetical protein